MSYKVRLRKQIHGCFAAASNLDIMLSFDIELPFPPFYGLTVDGPWEDAIELEAGETQIVWDTRNEQFYVFVQPDKTIYNAQLRRESHPTVEEVAAPYLADGWQKEWNSG